MRPIRFCMPSTFYPPWNLGGDGVQVQRLAHALADRGHEVTVVHSREGYRALGRAPRGDVETHPRVSVVPIDARVGLLSPLVTHASGHPLLARRQLQKTLSERFDVIHFHNPSLLGGPGILGMGEGIKLYTTHEHWLLCPGHVLWRRGHGICDQPPCWSCELSHGRPPQLWRRTRLLERSLAQLDALIVPSRTSARLHERFSSVVPIEQLAHFVPTPVGGDVPAGGAREPIPGRPFFLYAGRLEANKGIDVLLRAFERRRSEDLVVVGAGRGTPLLRRAAGTLPHVHFAGWLSSAQLGAFYRDAMAVIVPSLSHETFGLVAVEALANGTPVVVPSFGALEELVRESGGGVTYSSEPELDDALERLASDPGLRRRLGDRGRAAYLERWTPEVHVRRYLGLIARIARERGNADLAAAAAASSGEPVRA